MIKRTANTALLTQREAQEPYELPQMLTVEQVAKRLAMTTDSVYRLCRAGKIPHYKLDGKRGGVRIGVRDLLYYLDMHRVRVSGRPADAHSGVQELLNQN